MDEQRNVIQIGTLGPSGTSSEAAAAYFIQTDEKNHENYSIPHSAAKLGIKLPI